jgi:hypothetical protein
VDFHRSEQVAAPPVADAPQIVMDAHFPRPYFFAGCEDCDSWLVRQCHGKSFQCADVVIDGRLTFDDNKLRFDKIDTCHVRVAFIGKHQ